MVPVFVVVFLALLAVALFIALCVTFDVKGMKIRQLERDLDGAQQYREADRKYSSKTQERLSKDIARHQEAFVALSKIIPAQYKILSTLSKPDYYGQQYKQWDYDLILRLAKLDKKDAQSKKDRKVLEALSK